MMSQTILCRLCVTQCDDHKSLLDENGHYTGIYNLVAKYFDSKLLNSVKGSVRSVLCSLCWRQIFDFHNFQQFVLEAQERLNVISYDKPELKFAASAIEINEFLPLESPVSTSVHQELQKSIFISGDTGISLSSPQQEIIDVFSYDGSHSDNEITLLDESDYPDEISLNGEGLNKLEEINEITEILSSDEEGFPEDQLSSAVESLNVTNEKPTNSNNKDVRMPLMDVDDDAVIAQWKPNLECRLCSRKFSPSFKLLRDHFREKHPLRKFYVTCCRRKFYYRCKLAEHIRLHTNTHPYKCKFCSKSYTRKANLISHLHTHQPKTKNKEFIQDNKSLATETAAEELLLNEVKIKMQSKYTKKKKYKQLHNSNSSTVLYEDIQDDDAVIAQWKPTLKCEVCGENYLSFTPLRDHFRKMHPQDTFYVECCRRKFKYRCMLGDHIRRHINPHPFKCKFCIRSYSQRANLITHMQEQHNHRPKKTDQQLDDLIGQWEQKLECAHCSHTYSSIKLLRHHYRYQHPTKMFHISCCGRKYTRRREIETHIRSHLKIVISILRCEQCDKCFTTKISLDRHYMQLHSDAKTYSCTSCDECFISKEDLNVHKRRNHPGTSTYGRRMSSRRQTANH